MQNCQETTKKFAKQAKGRAKKKRKEQNKQKCDCETNKPLK